MDPLESGTPPPPAAARPSLFGNGQPAPAAGRQSEPISILSSLDKNDGKKPLRASTGLPNWFTIAVGSLLGITIGAAIVVSLLRDTGSITRGMNPSVVPRAPEPQAVPAVVAVPPAPTVDQSAAAAIENAPPAAVAAAAPPEPPPQVVAISPPPAMAEAAKAQGAPAQPEATVEPPVRTRPERNAPPASHAKPRETRTETARATALPNDRDASLIAALVAYGEGKPANEINASAAPLTAKPAADRPPTGAAAVAQSGDGFDPKRDVVTRDANVSTAELVRRCKALGFFEGLLCRNRVCSNLWGKDPACPQSSAAPAARTGTP